MLDFISVAESDIELWVKTGVYPTICITVKSVVRNLQIRVQWPKKNVPNVKNTPTLPPSYHLTGPLVCVFPKSHLFDTVSGTSHFIMNNHHIMNRGLWFSRAQLTLFNRRGGGGDWRPLLIGHSSDRQKGGGREMLR